MTISKALAVSSSVEYRVSCVLVYERSRPEVVETKSFLLGKAIAIRAPPGY